jgi:hypothetical protein
MRTIVAVLLSALLAACMATKPDGQRAVFPESTGFTSKMPTQTDEITDIGFEPFYNRTADRVRLQSVAFASPPLGLRVLSVRAYDYRQTKEAIIGMEGDLAKECPHLFKPKPISSYITPPHGASSWFVVIAFTISKPGRYYLNRVKIDYVAAGRPGWQYITINTAMIVANPPNPGPTPLPSSAVCG